MEVVGECGIPSGSTRYSMTKREWQSKSKAKNSSVEWLREAAPGKEGPGFPSPSSVGVGGSARLDTDSEGPECGGFQHSTLGSKEET